MKKTAAIFSAIVILCLLAALTVTAAAGELSSTQNSGEIVIDVTVPQRHKVTVNAGDDVDIEILEGGEVSQTGEGSGQVEIDRLKPVKIKITPDEGKKISKILVDGEDVTDKYEDGVLTLDPTNKDITLTIETEEDTLSSSVSSDTEDPFVPTDPIPPIEPPSGNSGGRILLWIVLGLVVLTAGGALFFYFKKHPGAPKE